MILSEFGIVSTSPAALQVSSTLPNWRKRLPSPWRAINRETTLAACVERTFARGETEATAGRADRLCNANAFEAARILRRQFFATPQPTLADSCPGGGLLPTRKGSVATGRFQDS